MRIYLTGFMGAGKSYAGKVLAKSLELNYFDLDTIIEQTEKITVKHIFDSYGEDYFRDAESKILFSKLSEGVFATGGGVIERKENRSFLGQKDNFVIWLNTPWDVIIKRIENSDRPIVKSKSLEEIRELYFSRLEKYKETADLEVITVSLDYILKNIPKK